MIFWWLIFDKDVSKSLLYLDITNLTLYQIKGCHFWHISANFPKWNLKLKWPPSCILVRNSLYVIRFTFHISNLCLIKTLYSLHLCLRLYCIDWNFYLLLLRYFSSTKLKTEFNLYFPKSTTSQIKRIILLTNNRNSHKPQSK